MKYIVVGVLCVVGYATLAQTADDYPKNTKHRKFIERIAGQWTLQQIVDVEKQANQPRAADEQSPERTDDIETDQATNAMRKIEFFEDARYRMNDSQQTIDSGSYRLNEQHGILYLQSDQDTSPVEWKISVQNKRLTLTGRGEEATSRYQYVYRKTKENVAR